MVLESAMQSTSVDGSIAIQQNALFNTNSPSQARSNLELPPLRLALQSGEEADQRHLQSQEFQQVSIINMAASYDIITSCNTKISI